MNNTSMPRRDFLRTCLRQSVLLLGAAATARLWRRTGGALEDQTCHNHGICVTCSNYRGCGLPAALSRRRQKEGAA